MVRTRRTALLTRWVFNLFRLGSRVCPRELSFMPTKSEVVDKTNVYSWSAKVDFTLGRGYALEELSGDTVFVWESPYVVALSRRRIHPDLESAGTTGYRLVVNAESTAGAAEVLGLHLAFGLLWMGVTQHYAIGLEWPESPLPCRVIDRTASSGISLQGFGSVSRRLQLAEFVSRLEQGFSKAPAHLLPRLLVSMELYCGSKLETSKRARFVMLISALEAISEQAPTGEKVEKIVETVLVPAIHGAQFEQNTQDSLIGRIRELKRESARGAIRRLLREYGFESADLQLIDSAYMLRSSIVHEGRRVPELDAAISQVEPILSSLYARTSGLSL